MDYDQYELLSYTYLANQTAMEVVQLMYERIGFGASQVHSFALMVTW